MARSATPAQPVSRWAIAVVPVICWLALISDGYDLFSYGATLPGLIDADPGTSPPPRAVWSAA